MHKFSLSLRALLLAITLVVSVARPPAVVAQASSAPGPSVDVAKLQEVILEGRSLEQESRWGDALAYYEDALRLYPGRLELKQRVMIARAHLDIARRYSDRSFLGSLEKLSGQQALELYAEVLDKIESYYVDSPDWQGIVDRGVTSLEVATTESGFVDQFPQPVSTDYRHAFSNAWRARQGSAPIKTKDQAIEAAVTAAEMASQYLRVSSQATILEFTCGAAAALDQYSAYLTGEQLDEVFSQIEGNFVGLGIELKPNTDSLLIVNIIPEGPAEQAGMRAGDRILEVDGKSVGVVSADTAADMLKGPEMSFVNILLQSPNQEPRDIRVQRRQVEVPSIQDIQIVDTRNGVGYMKLAAFQKTTSRDMDTALWQLHRQGMRSLIIDVRGNPGGLLNAAVEVADKFLDRGTIVSTRGRRAGEDFDYRSHQVGTWRMPLALLIDGDSASASEIFAGAIQDHRRGAIVGETSYGKGSVQGIFPLSRFKSGIRLTTAKFYSPNGTPISHHGVIPNVSADSDQRHLTAKALASGQVLSPNAQTDGVLWTAVDVLVNGRRRQSAPLN